MNININIDWPKIILFVLLSVLLIFIGYRIGSNNNKIEEVTIVKYERGEEIHDTMFFDLPYKIIEPIDTADIIAQCVLDGKFYELFPEKIKDTTIIITKSDTTKIMRDWASTKIYKDILFDIDTVGRFDYDIEVQYNEIKKFGYNFSPVTKTTISNKTITKKYSPFIGAGISMYPSFTVSAGLFVDDSWGFGITGRYLINIEKDSGLNKYDLGLSVLKKF